MASAQRTPISDLEITETVSPSAPPALLTTGGVVQSDKILRRSAVPRAILADSCRESTIGLEYLPIDP